MAVPVVEEGKLLSEALNTVKIQVQQMKRHLVCLQQNRDKACPFMSSGNTNASPHCRSWINLWTP
jgi:hypothetical protein